MVLVQQQFPPGGGLTYQSASLGSTSDLGHGVHRDLGRQDGREPVSSCEVSAPGNSIYSLFWFVVVLFFNVREDWFPQARMSGYRGRMIGVAAPSERCIQADLTVQFLSLICGCLTDIKSHLRVLVFPNHCS